jgi:hypothetical protein
VFSSRKIARKLEEDVAFRVLGAGNFPDRRTVNRFRQEHWEEFAGNFGPVVKLARERKLIRMGTLAENFTDPESRIMKTQDGFQQCYNGQIAVEAGSGLIVANDVVQNAADKGCLVGMTEAAQAQGGEKPERVLADAGYRSEENFRKLAEKKITAYVALGREGKRGKDIVPSAKNPHTQAMQERLRSEPGRGGYRKRKWLAEPPFGWSKHVLGVRRFRLRGHKKVKAEWPLVCAALHLKRIAVLTTP